MNFTSKLRIFALIPALVCMGMFFLPAANTASAEENDSDTEVIENDEGKTEDTDGVEELTFDENDSDYEGDYDSEESWEGDEESDENDNEWDSHSNLSWGRGGSDRDRHDNDRFRGDRNRKHDNDRFRGDRSRKHDNDRFRGDRDRKGKNKCNTRDRFRSDRYDRDRDYKKCFDNRFDGRFLGNQCNKFCDRCDFRDGRFLANQYCDKDYFNRYCKKNYNISRPRIYGGVNYPTGYLGYRDRDAYCPYGYGAGNYCDPNVRALDLDKEKSVDLLSDKNLSTKKENFLNFRDTQLTIKNLEEKDIDIEKVKRLRDDSSINRLTSLYPWFVY